MENINLGDSPDQIDPYEGYGAYPDDIPNFISIEPYEGRPPPVIHGGRIITAHSDVHREFLHIIVRSSNDNLFNQTKQRRPMVVCDTDDGPFMTKWSLHFYPDGHPSNYMIPDMDWFPHQQFIPPEEKFASLYVRLKEGYEMVEARMMTTVLSGDADIEAAIATNMERFMLCPRMKVDEFHKDAAGHGWPKLCPTESLKRFPGSFMCVVSLQVLQPATSMSIGAEMPKKTPILIQKYSSSKETKPFVMTNLRHSNAYTDAILQAHNWQFVRAHRFILVKSGVLKKKIMEDQGIPFVYKTNHSIEQLNLLLDMLYTGRLPCRTNSLSKILLDLAIMYDIPVIAQALLDDEQRFVGSNDRLESCEDDLDINIHVSNNENGMQIEVVV